MGLPAFLRVATCNLRVRRSLDATVGRIAELLQAASADGAHVLALPEAALPGYDADIIARTPSTAIDGAESAIRATCRDLAIGCVFGRPRDGFNEAVVVDEGGDVVARQPKLQLVPTDAPWTTRRGSRQVVFPVRGVPCAAIICHDKRYPELVRLPVMAGARVIFYLSCETYHDDAPLPSKAEEWPEDRMAAELGAYAAQTAARAVENGVFVVKANVAAPHSHGASSVVGPTGVALGVSDARGEAVLTRDLALADARAPYARKALDPAYAHSAAWRAMLASSVDVI